MPRRSSSQWDFGELFPPEETRRVLSVGELTRRVKQLLEQQVGTVWVGGEVTNLRLQSSGHMYFTLKDAAAQVACVLFRGERVTQRDALEDGRKIIVQGEVTVYEARGQYQLIVRQMELQGLGALQAAFEKLKRKLEAEGLFSEERKRPLPRFPRRIGIVTSSTGAALADVLHVVQRRHPALELILAPCRVQGEGAAAEVAASIELLNAFAAAEPDRPIDAILVTRGGGSLEDLWAFNEEVVARAVAASGVPVVSAVGHEIDFTICDFVADVRAATPSAAAEILTEGVFSAARLLLEVPGRLQRAARQRVLESREDLESLRGRIRRAHPRRRLNESAQRLDELQVSCGRSMRQGLTQARREQVHLLTRFRLVRPEISIAQAREQTVRHQARLSEQVRRHHTAARDRFKGAVTRLRLLGPEQVLARGYSITTDAESGRILRRADATAEGQRIVTRLSDGSVRSRVER